MTIRGILIHVCCIAWAAVCCAATPIVGDIAPDVSGEMVQGKAITLSQLKGTVVYLDFWASWCPPCRQSLPWLEALRTRYRSSGFEVLAVNEDSDSVAAKKMVEEVSASFPVIWDREGAIATRYSPPAMPSSFLIDRTGRIHSVFKGFRDGDEQKIEAAIKELIASQKG